MGSVLVQQFVCGKNVCHKAPWSELTLLGISLETFGRKLAQVMVSLRWRHEPKEAPAGTALWYHLCGLRLTRIERASVGGSSESRWPWLTVHSQSPSSWSELRVRRPVPWRRLQRSLECGLMGVSTSNTWATMVMFKRTKSMWISGSQTGWGQTYCQWENLWFPVDFPLNQSIDYCYKPEPVSRNHPFLVLKAPWLTVSYVAWCCMNTWYFPAWSHSSPTILSSSISPIYPYWQSK